MNEVLLEMEDSGFLSFVFDDHSNSAGDDNLFDGKEITIDEQTYCILLNGLCRVQRIEKAEEILAKLVENWVTSSKISNNILVNAYCQKGDLKKAIPTSFHFDEFDIWSSHNDNCIVNYFSDREAWTC